MMRQKVLALMRKQELPHQPLLAYQPKPIRPARPILRSPPPNLSLRESIEKLRQHIETSHWRDGSPLSLAQQILENDLRSRNLSLSEAGPSNYAVKGRDAVYDEVLLAFANRPDHVKAILSLISQQMYERIPLSVRAITIILKLAINSQAPEKLLPMIHKVLPQLPETMDLHLLTLVLSALIKASKPKPDDVEKLLGESLAPLGYRSFENWPIRMYDLLMQAHRTDFQGALKLLARIRETVDRRPKETWTREVVHDISRVYITLMDMWTRNHVRHARKTRSPAPLRLAEGLIGVLPHPEDVPREFANGWMNAERINGNYWSVFEIWSRYFDTDVRSKDRQPDNYSYETLWKTYKMIDEHVSRKEVGYFLSSIKGVTVDSYNCALSAVFAQRKPDLPLALLLLNHMPSSVLLNKKTIDITAAGMIRRWRQTSSHVYKPTPEDMSERQLDKIKKHRRRLRGVHRLPQAAGITLKEWDTISNEIHWLRTDLDPVKQLLPLDRPLGRLESVADSAKAKSSRAIQSPISFPIPIAQHSDPVQVFYNEADTSFSESTGRRLLQALKRLLESSIIERYRHEPGWDTSNHRASLARLMESVREEALSSTLGDSSVGLQDA